MLIILLGSFEFWLFVAQEVEREYADWHCSIGSPLPCHCWELDRAVSNKAIWAHHYHFSMGTLYHGIMFQFYWLALTQEQLPAFRNIARNNLDGTVRSSELRGTIVNCRSNRFSFGFVLYMIIQYRIMLTRTKNWHCHSDCNYPRRAEDHMMTWWVPRSRLCSALL